MFIKLFSKEKLNWWTRIWESIRVKTLINSRLRGNIPKWPSFSVVCSVSISMHLMRSSKGFCLWSRTRCCNLKMRSFCRFLDCCWPCCLHWRIKMVTSWRKLRRSWRRLKPLSARASSLVKYGRPCSGRHVLGSQPSNISIKGYPAITNEPKKRETKFTSQKPPSKSSRMKSSWKRTRTDESLKKKCLSAYQSRTCSTFITQTRLSW